MLLAAREPRAAGREKATDREWWTDISSRVLNALSDTVPGDWSYFCAGMGMQHNKFTLARFAKWTVMNPGSVSTCWSRSWSFWTMYVRAAGTQIYYGTIWSLIVCRNKPQLWAAMCFPVPSIIMLQNSQTGFEQDKPTRVRRENTAQVEFPVTYSKLF